MTESIENALSTCERALAAGEPLDLKGKGFWRAVGQVKRNPELIEEYADRIAEIDRVAFEAWAWKTFPIRLGDALLWAGTVIGLAVISTAYYVDAPWNGLLLLAGTGALLATTHGLAHLVVGRAMGIRFTHWFIGSLAQPQPGVKTDYATYLRTAPRKRAWMHASGALATKLTPFLMLGAAWGADVPSWAWWVLIVLGILMIVSDLALSITKGDWKKFRREMGVARSLEA